MGGITYNSTELSRWRYRRANGYTKPTNMPDTLAWSQARADYFVANPTTDYYTGDPYTESPGDMEHILSSAWEYLCDGSSTYGDPVHDFIVSQVQEPSVDYSTFTTLSTGGDYITFTATWANKLFYSYDYTRDLYTAGEITLIQQWFFDVAMFFQRSANERTLGLSMKFRSDNGKYDTIVLMLADQSNQIESHYYWVKETNLNYEYNGVATGSELDYTERQVAKRQHFYDDDTYADQAALLADQGNHTLGECYTHAGRNWGESYIFLGVATGSINDYKFQRLYEVEFYFEILEQTITTNYTNEADMLANQGSQNEFLYYTYTGITEGKCYKYKGVANGLITDYYDTTVVIHTHVNSSDQPQNQIGRLGGSYNNRTALWPHLMTIVGLEVGDDFMIDQARLWHEESIMFGIFPDGECSEARRNGDYGYLSQGVCAYAIIHLESHIRCAELLRKNRGDVSLYTFTTSLGMKGTEGGTKNLRLWIENIIEHCTTEVSRYYLEFDAANLLDPLETVNNRRHLPEMIVAPANNYYREDRIKTTYLNTISGSIQYETSYSYGTGGVGYTFGGGIGSVPDFSTMEYEMEDLYDEKIFHPEFTLAKGIANLEPDEAFPNIVQVNNSVFVSFADSNRRQKAAEFNRTTGVVAEYFVDPNPDWACKDDEHHVSSIGIDPDGYLWLSTDMHNYPNNSSYDAYLPDRYKNKIILLWKSDSPYDASSWTFVGDNATICPDITKTSNQKFITDNNGVLYMTARMHTHGTNTPGVRGIGMYKYDNVSGQWNELGAVPPQYDNSYGTYDPVRKCVFWSKGGCQTPIPYYQSWYEHIYFDEQNRIHMAVATAAAEIPSVDFYDTVLYAMSDNEGVTWKKADGTTLVLPVAPHAGSSQGDLIVEDQGGSGVTSQSGKVAFDDDDNPIVMYHIKGDQGYIRSWNGSVWSSPAVNIRNGTPTPFPHRLGGKNVLRNGYSTSSRLIMTEDCLIADDDLNISGQNLTFRVVDKPGVNVYKKLYGVNVNSVVSKYEFGYIFYNIPIADAGDDQNITTSDTSLDGSNSYHLNGAISSYLWEQVSGPVTATIVTPSAAQTTVQGLSSIGEYVFKLTVGDSAGYTDSITMLVTALSEDVVLSYGAQTMLF